MSIVDAAYGGASEPFACCDLPGPVGMAGGGLGSELDAVLWPVEVVVGCEAGVVVGDGELPCVDVGDGLEVGGVDYGSDCESVGGVVAGLDGCIDGTGAVSIEADCPGWRSVSMCDRYSKG